MMLARIYNKSKSSTQSGKKGRTGKWVLEFERQIAPYIEPLLGYTSSKDTLQQVKLFFLIPRRSGKICKRS
nr:NADH dehydrogenase ubiquinone Fe-S protein 4 [Candidatus Liberibacter solanacearum]